MRTQVSAHNQGEHSEDDRRPTAAVMTRDAFSDAGDRYSAQQDKRTGGRVDGLLRAHAALVHEIE